MAFHLQELEGLDDLHRSAGSALFAACEAEIFPCDALTLAVLDRSLGLLRGFKALLNDGGYSSGMCLLRLQIDNILRLHGVITSGDAHACASKVLAGTQLRELKNKDGKHMSDGHLVKTLVTTIPWIKDVYETCSGYVHLSSQHVNYFLARCPRDQNGKLLFTIGDEDDHVPIDAKFKLTKAFVGATTGVTKLVTAWSEVRETHGSNEILKRTYSAAA